MREPALAVDTSLALTKSCDFYANVQFRLAVNRAEFGVTGIGLLHWRAGARLGWVLAVALAAIVSHMVMPAQAATERALYLYYTHTKETARIVFKRNGQYVQSGLNELNYFLRDWRRNEPTKMDPRLFDLVWEVYQEVGATQPINIVSAYRAPATNEMLRKTTSGVAENSQHTKGHAMDFFIPGIPLTKLRAVAMHKQVGGVGYYPTSGSPFVHLDTGSVRAWPRMTRAQLKEIFPDGRTMHLPPDGKPLSQQGYKLAMAEWKQCHEVPCGGNDSGTRVASNGGGGGATLMDLLFGGKDQGQAAQPALRTAALTPQANTPQIAPMPLMRPADLGGPLVTASAPALPFSTQGSAPLDAAELAPDHVAPMPATMSETLRLAMAGDNANDAVTALAALTEPPVPQPRLIMSGSAAEPLSAYLPSAQQGEGAQEKLQAIIQSAVATALPPAPGQRRPILPDPDGATIRTASLGPMHGDALADLFAGTFQATRSDRDGQLAAALNQRLAKSSGAMRRPDFIAPDLEHVGEVFTTPDAMTSSHFAVIFDRDEADFDPTPEMGRYVIVMGAGDDTTGLGHEGFVPQAPLAIASN